MSSAKVRTLPSPIELILANAAVYILNSSTGNKGDPCGKLLVVILKVK